MNYDEFRDLWHNALLATHLHMPYPIGPTERIILRDMSRSYELALYGAPHLQCDPFHLVTTIEWNWYTTLSARYETTEEDILVQGFGDFGIHDDDTVAPRSENHVDSMQALRNIICSDRWKEEWPKIEDRLR